MNGETIIRELDRIYGPGKGAKIYMNVIPGILADFQKMLKNARPGQTVTEEYILDDGNAALKLSGRAGFTGIPEIEAEVKRL